jgi:hypothetical protein
MASILFSINIESFCIYIFEAMCLEPPKKISSLPSLLISPIAVAGPLSEI